MDEEKYVPQIGDIVYGEQASCHGLYVGQREYARRFGNGLHYYVMADDGKCTCCEIVKKPYFFDVSRAGMEADAARVLFGICESFLTDPGLAAKAYGYRDPAAQREMPPELSSWWAQWHPQLTKNAFVSASVEMRKAQEAIATIQKLDGEPSVALQERLDAATFKLERYRAKIIDIYQVQIRNAQEMNKLPVTV